MSKTHIPSNQKMQDSELIKFCDEPRTIKDFQVKFNVKPTSVYQRLNALADRGAVKKYKDLPDYRWKFLATSDPWNVQGFPTPHNPFCLKREEA